MAFSFLAHIQVCKMVFKKISITVIIKCIIFCITGGPKQWKMFNTIYLCMTSYPSNQCQSNFFSSAAWNKIVLVQLLSRVINHKTSIHVWVKESFSRNANIVTQLFEVNLLIPYLCKTDWKVYNNTTVSCNTVLQLISWLRVEQTSFSTSGWMSKHYPVTCGTNRKKCPFKCICDCSSNQMLL